MGGRILAAAALALVACGPRGPGAHPEADILLISIDTLRADHVGLLGYQRPTTPSIDRFFAGGRIYQRAYSAAAKTTPSIVSLLSGLLPHEHRVRLFNQMVPDDVRLASDLLPPDRQRAAFVSNMVLADEAIGLARRFDVYDDFLDERESSRLVFERDAGRTTDAVLRWLAAERDPARPIFLWVHYIDPHGPYRPPPGAPARFEHTHPLPIEPRKIPSHQLDPSVTDGADYVDRYDEEIAYVDAQVGRLLTGYAGRFDLDRALVVLTADHGETMAERERWFSHGFQVYEELVRVPLLLRGPGVVPGRSELPVAGTDVAPTLLRFAGVEPPAGLSRVDLRDGHGLGPDRLILVEATTRLRQWRAAIRGRKKWVVEVRGPERRVGVRRAFALDEDPDERWPRAFEPSDRDAKALLSLVESDPDPSGVSGALPRLGLAAPHLARDVSPDTRRRLEALGYIEPEADVPAAPGIDARPAGPAPTAAPRRRRSRGGRGRSARSA